MIDLFDIQKRLVDTNFMYSDDLNLGEIDAMSPFTEIHIHIDGRRCENINDFKRKNREMVAKINSTQLRNRWIPWVSGNEAGPIVKEYKRGNYGGIGEIIYYTDKYDYEGEIEEKSTSKATIKELIEFSNSYPTHPTIQIHWRITDKEDMRELLEMCSANPNANVLLCHCGYERGDDFNEWFESFKELADNTYNVKFEISFMILKLFFEQPSLMEALSPWSYRITYATDYTEKGKLHGGNYMNLITRLNKVKTIL